MSDTFDTKKFVEAIRKKRGKQTQRQLGFHIGLSAATISRVENGKEPDLNTFFRLCEWLCMNPQEFHTKASGQKAAEILGLAEKTEALRKELGNMVVCEGDTDRLEEASGYMTDARRYTSLAAESIRKAHHAVVTYPVEVKP
jgi:transcriptional regulator with XRE-family HTH domain